jgi:hypothetical protein
VLYWLCTPEKGVRNALGFGWVHGGNELFLLMVSVFFIPK